MYDGEALQTINGDQLATATDRLLIHRGRMPRYRPTAVHDAAEETVYVRRARPRVKLAAPRRRRAGSTTAVVLGGLVSGLCFAGAVVAALV